MSGIDITKNLFPEANNSYKNNKINLEHELLNALKVAYISNKGNLKNLKEFFGSEGSAFQKKLEKTFLLLDQAKTKIPKDFEAEIRKKAFKDKLNSILKRVKEITSADTKIQKKRKEELKEFLSSIKKSVEGIDKIKKD